MYVGIRRCCSRSVSGIERPTNHLLRKGCSLSAVWTSVGYVRLQLYASRCDAMSISMVTYPHVGTKSYQNEELQLDSRPPQYLILSLNVDKSNLCPWSPLRKPNPTLSSPKPHTSRYKLKRRHCPYQIVHFHVRMLLRCLFVSLAGRFWG